MATAPRPSLTRTPCGRCPARGVHREWAISAADTADLSSAPVCGTPCATKSSQVQRAWGNTKSGEGALCSLILPERRTPSRFQDRAPTVDNPRPGGHEGEGSGPAYPRHTASPAYRCFLPDLAGFTGVRCAGPGPSTPSPTVPTLSTNASGGRRPRYSGLRVQGTATSPSSTVNLADEDEPHLGVRPGAVPPTRRHGPSASAKPMHVL